jgi:hypothetical protein
MLKENMNNLSISLIYIDKSYIQHVQNIVVAMKEGVLYSEQLLNILSSNNKFRNKKYNLHSIVKYNVVNDDDENIDNKNISEIQSIHNIEFEPNVAEVNKLTSLYLILKKKEYNVGTQTRKINISVANKKTKRKYVN